MAMTEDEKKEHKALLAEAFADGLALFRSKQEEEAAKAAANQPEVKKEGNAGDSANGGLTLAGFILGGK